MARTAPDIYCEIPQGRTIGQIVSCEGVFAVFYKGVPFQYKHVNQRIDGIRYGRTVFVNKAHAVGLVNKLNEKTRSKDFHVETLA